MNYTDKIIYYPLFEAADVKLVEVEVDDAIIEIGDFLSNCIKGCFTDYAGFGYFVKYVDGKPYAITNVSFSIDDDEVYYEDDYIGGIFLFCNNFDIDKVVWFNK